MPRICETPDLKMPLYQLPKWHWATKHVNCVTKICLLVRKIATRRQINQPIARNSSGKTKF